MIQRFSMNLMQKLLRYSAVSAISTVISLTILGALIATGTTTAGWANLIATGVGTLPSFELNRRWVWGKTGRRSVSGEIGPFCALSFAGLALSTLAVSVASRWATGDGLGVGARTLVAEGTNIATFGTLWVAQFVILDRVLFRGQGRRTAGTIRSARTAPARGDIQPMGARVGDGPREESTRADLRAA